MVPNSASGKHAAFTVIPRKTRMTFRYACAAIGGCSVAFLAVVGYLLATGHGLIWKPDATAQYFTYFIVQGEMLREGLETILSGSLPTLQTFTLTQGYGADIIQTMGSDCSNPLNLISVFFTPENAEFGFCLVIWMRVVLAGLAFSLYCFNRGKVYGPTFVGMLCYVLCGYMVFWGMLRHPGFMNTGILLPLALLGADRVFARERPYWLVFAVGLSFLMSAYFTYMLCVLLLGYCLVKYFFAPRERSVGDFVILVGRFIGFLLLAFALGAVVGLPYVEALTSMGRVSSSTTVPLLFSISYYADYLPNLLGLYMVTRGLYLGVIPLFLSLLFLFGRKCIDALECRSWTIGLLLVIVMTLVPWFGHAINGFSYVSDRWMIALGFVFSYICVLVVSSIGKFEKKTLRLAAVLLGIAAVFSMALTCIIRGPIAIAFGIPTLMLIIAAWYFCQKQENMAIATISALAVIGAVCAVIIVLIPQGGGLAGEFIKLGEGYEMVCEDTAGNADLLMADDEQHRYSVPGVISTKSNDPLLHDNWGIIFYSSVYNQPLDDLRDGLGIWSNHKNFLYGGNDGRLAVDALSGAKYFIARDVRPWLVPYSYDDTGVSNESYRVYQTDNHLALAFSVDSVINRADYEALSLVGKQEALLQGAVLEEGAFESAMSSEKPDTHAVSVPFEVVESDGVELSGNRLVVKDAKATMRLRFKGIADAETYLCFTNMRFESIDPLERAAIDGREPTLGDQYRQLLFREPTMYTIVATIGEREQTMNVNTPASTAFVNRFNWALNMGYSHEAQTEIDLRFSTAGYYDFDALTIECQPVKPVVERLQTLKKRNATDFTVDGNTISAHFDIPESNAYALFTIPFSKGWRATVDGDSAELLRADIGFIGVQLQGAGSHTVELHYETPGLLYGAIASAAGILVLIAYVLFRSRRKASAGNADDGVI